MIRRLSEKGWCLLMATKAPAHLTRAACLQPVTPSKALAAIVGARPLPRTEVRRKLWAYIKKNGLEDPKRKSRINADAKLTVVFGGKKSVSMFEMTKLVSDNLK